MIGKATCYALAVILLSQMIHSSVFGSQDSQSHGAKNPLEEDIKLLSSDGLNGLLSKYDQVGLKLEVLNHESENHGHEVLCYKLPHDDSLNNLLITQSISGEVLVHFRIEWYLAFNQLDSNTYDQFFFDQIKNCIPSMSNESVGGSMELYYLSYDNVYVAVSVYNPLEGNPQLISTDMGYSPRSLEN